MLCLYSLALLERLYIINTVYYLLYSLYYLYIYIYIIYYLQR